VPVFHSGALNKEIESMTLRTALIAGTILGLGTISALSVPATAATIGTANPVLSGMNGSDGVVTKVQNRKWDRRRHGDRRRHREGRYRYFYGGYYYATPWWQVGVGLPGVPGVVVGIPTPWTPAWFTYCERKYGRFDRRTGRYYRGGRWIDCR
jgi:hypothetical protein